MEPERHPSEWWFAAVLLVMLAALMASHIGVIWVAVARCDLYSEARIEIARERYSKPADSRPVPVPAAECDAIYSRFTDVANLYLATILALLSGAGFSAGRAWIHRGGKQKDEDP